MVDEPHSLKPKAFFIRLLVKLKPLIMSKIQLIFQSSDKSDHDSEMICHNNSQNEIFIQISRNNYESQFIVLDIPTAIKFSKVLRTSIADAKELGENG